MFRVDFFVDDKKLGPALFALVGIAQGQPGVTPVVNAMEKDGKIVAKVNGNSLERFADALKALKGKTIAASDIKPIVKSLGLRPASRGYLLKRARDAGLLKKSGTGSASKYVVL